jgi:hypothetical protein
MIFIAAVGVVATAVVFTAVAAGVRFSELLSPAPPTAPAAPAEGDVVTDSTCTSHLLNLYHH